MKQDDIRTGRHYRMDSGARVEVLKTRVSGFSGRHDSVRVKYVGGRRDGQEVKVLSREIKRPWNEDDAAREAQRAANNKKVGAFRVRLAALGFDEAEMRASARGDNSVLVQFWGDTTEQVVAMLERASEERAA